MSQVSLNLESAEAMYFRKMQEVAERRLAIGSRPSLPAKPRAPRTVHAVPRSAQAEAASQPLGALAFVLAAALLVLLGTCMFITKDGNGSRRDCPRCSADVALENLVKSCGRGGLR